MNYCCYTVLIKQITCQNGIPRNINNTYTNVTDNSVISLSFGYSLTVISVNTSYMQIKLSNINYIPDLYFNIPIDSYKIFSVPKENGTLRIYVGVKASECKGLPTNTCCNNI